MLDNFQEKVEIFDDNRPGYKWIMLFEKRHPEISLRTPQTLVKSRSAVQQTNIENWFTEVENYLRTSNLFGTMSKADRVSNYFHETK